MKKILTSLLLLLVIVGFAQDTDFKFTKDGFTDFVVVECEKKTQSELYKKTLDWVAVTYNTPNVVLKGQIENDYIRLEGSAKDVIANGMKYQIEISFKEGKYKFDIIRIQFWSEMDYLLIGQTDWKEFEIVKMDKYFDRQGEIKGRYKPVLERITKYFNSLNSNLKDFLLSEQIPSKRKDW